MNATEKQGIVDALHDWSIQCIETDVYPVLLLGMPKDGEGNEIKIWKGGPFANVQLRQFLLAVANSIPDTGSYNPNVEVVG